MLDAPRRTDYTGPKTLALALIRPPSPPAVVAVQLPTGPFMPLLPLLNPVPVGSSLGPEDPSGLRLPVRASNPSISHQPSSHHPY